MATAVEDKAGQEYWDKLWDETELSKAANPHLPGLRNLHVRRLDELFREIFGDNETHGKSLLETGCGRSIWLPYFAKEFGFR